MTSNHGPTPTEEVLEAFGIVGTASPLAGGQGECFVVSDERSGEKVVLKPTRDVEETEFLCEMQAQLCELKNEHYRIAQPIPCKDDRSLQQFQTSIPNDRDTIITLKYIASDTAQQSNVSWTATQFVQGEGDSTVRMAELLPASRALHEDLKRIYTAPPACIAKRTDRWAWADRFVWSEVSLQDIPNVDWELANSRIMGSLTRLEKLLVPVHDLHERLTQSQLLHGDLSGNLLFSPGLPPAIIDFSPYWRPVAFAEAIPAADLLMWSKGTVEDLRELGLLEGNERVQMLLRAVIFRLVTFAVNPDPGFVERNLDRLDVDATIRIMEALV